MKQVAILLGMLTIAGVASAQTSAGAPPRTEAPIEMISVSGVGKVRLSPDRVRFTVGVDTVAPTPAEALRLNNEKIQAVIDALVKAGAKPDEIQTSNFNLHPQFEYLENRHPRIIGYQVSNSVTVDRTSSPEIGRLLQVAVDAGVNQASGLQFYVGDEARARDQGLREAYADARAKADTLARAAGRTIGRAVSITEGSAPQIAYPPMGYAKVANMEARDASVPMSQGTEELQFTVSVIFEMR